LLLDGKLEGPGKLSWRGPSNYAASDAKHTIENVKLSNAGKYYLIANYKNCSSIDSVEVEVVKILGSELPNSDKIKAFPNPTNGFF